MSLGSGTRCCASKQMIFFNLGRTSPHRHRHHHRYPHHPALQRQAVLVRSRLRRSPSILHPSQRQRLCRRSALLARRQRCKRCRCKKTRRQAGAVASASSCDKRGASALPWTLHVLFSLHCWNTVAEVFCRHRTLVLSAFAGDHFMLYRFTVSSLITLSLTSIPHSHALFPSYSARHLCFLCTLLE